MVGIRGVGVVSPLAVGVREFSTALIDGVSAAAATDPSGECWARVGMDPADLLDTPKTYLDRASALALAAAAMARREAGRAVPAGQDGELAIESGVSVGTAYGCPDSMLRFWQSVVQKGPRLANSLFFSHSYPNIPGGMEAIEHGLAGAHLTFCQGAASGALAVAGAMDVLRLGQADRMLAGGFETLGPEDSPAFRGLSSLNGGEPVAPTLFFHDSRMVPGEGAVVLALESLNGPGDDAGACLARLLGSGTASFLPGLPVSQQDDGGAWGPPQAGAVQDAIGAAMRQALIDAGRAPGEVDLVILSACGPPLLDQAEARAVREVLAPAGVLGAVCTAMSARAGYCPGASALYGILAAAIALREEWVVEVGCPVEPDIAAQLNLAEEPVERQVSLALVNSVDENGACVCLVVG